MRPDLKQEVEEKKIRMEVTLLPETAKSPERKIMRVKRKPKSEDN